MSRSREFSLGRGRFRLSTATCCLRARTSRAVSRRLAEEDTDHGEDGEDEFRHELTLVTRCTVAREQASGSNCKVLISNLAEFRLHTGLIQARHAYEEDYDNPWSHDRWKHQSRKV